MVYKINKGTKSNKLTDDQYLSIANLINELPGAIKYNVSYDCKNSECTEDEVDYCCRCSTIIDQKITSVDVERIIEELIYEKCNDINKYCIDRLLRRRLGDTENYELDVCSGYYGEEVCGVILDGGILSRIKELLLSYEKCTTDIDKIKFVLNDEYGYLLNDVKDLSTVEVKDVAIDSIVKNENHYQKLNKLIVGSYKDYTKPVAICIDNDGKYRIIDGYHRLQAANNNKKQIITIIELS